MTYEKLRILIQSMTKKQRLCEVVVLIDNDDVHPISHIVINWFKFSKVKPPLDKDHPFLVI